MNINEILLIISISGIILGIIVGFIIYEKCKFPGHEDIGPVIGAGAVLLSIISALGIMIFPTTKDVKEIIIKEEISAFQDDTYNQIYGKVSGNFFYVNGEVSSAPETYITLVKIGDSGKVEFLNYKMSEVELYLVDENELEFPYIETSYYSVYEEYILFGKVINTESYIEGDEKIRIYLPADSLQYDNKVNG